jgi:phosphatidate cytidylyltransferase
VLRTRLITAALGIPLVLGAVWVGGALLAAVVAAAVAVACFEIAIAREAQRAPLSIVGALAAAVLPFAALAGEDYLLGGVAGVIAVVSTVFALTKDPRYDLNDWLWSLAMALYFGVLASHFVLLREAGSNDFGRDWLIFALITVWVTDTGAYFVGRPLGRHKMSPAVSPGKTWEGAAGSLIAGFACVFVLNEALDLQLETVHRVAFGLFLPVVILFGDLAESALKRGLGVKDSSGLVPGHGGIADRLDSLLFAIPAVYWYLKWIVL